MIVRRSPLALQKISSCTSLLRGTCPGRFISGTLNVLRRINDADPDLYITDAGRKMLRRYELQSRMAHERQRQAHSAASTDTTAQATDTTST